MDLTLQFCSMELINVTYGKNVIHSLAILEEKEYLIFT